MTREASLRADALAVLIQRQIVAKSLVYIPDGSPASIKLGALVALGSSVIEPLIEIFQREDIPDDQLTDLALGILKS